MCSTFMKIFYVISIVKQVCKVVIVPNLVTYCCILHNMSLWCDEINVQNVLQCFVFEITTQKLARPQQMLHDNQQVDYLEMKDEKINTTQKSLIKVILKLIQVIGSMVHASKGVSLKSPIIDAHQMNDNNIDNMYKTNASCINKNLGIELCIQNN